MVPRSLVMAAFVAVLLPASASADGSSPAEWRYGVEIDNTAVLLGHAPAFIVERRGDDRYDASERQRMGGAVRGRIRAEGKTLRLDIEPYTLIPDDALRVSAGGLEADVLLKVDGFGYVGYYHHSAHNFSYGGFGYGINLNGVVIDARWPKAVRFLDEDGMLQWRVLFHGYPIGEGPANVLTPETDIDPKVMGTTAWRTDGGVIVRHPKVRAECSASLVSAHSLPDAVRVSCAGMYRVGGWLGAYGDRLFVGPFFDAGINLSRADEFGRGTYSTGLRVDLVIAENTPLL